MNWMFLSTAEDTRIIMTVENSLSRGHHILAVDDNLIDRKLIEGLLLKSDYTVTTFDNGASVLQFLGLGTDKGQIPPVQGVEVSMIITDYSMPGMTGYELLKKIKGSSSLKEIPVVIMSSENQTAQMNRCLEEGAEEYLHKPVKLADVKRFQSYISKGTKDVHTEELIMEQPLFLSKNPVQLEA